MIDRQFDQLGKVLVCVHAVTIQHRGRETRSIDHDTHGHRLGQDKAQAGFEGVPGLIQGIGRPNVKQKKVLQHLVDVFFTNRC